MQEITTFALYIIPDSLIKHTHLHMKEFYIVLLAAALCVPGASAASRFKSKAAKRPAKTMIQKAPAASGTWRPVSVTEYMYGMFEENEWAELGTTTFSYDANGNVATETATYAEEEDSYSITVYTYDENGQILTSETSEFYDGTLEPSSRVEFVWDPVVKTFFTSRMGYDYNGTDWQTNYRCETNEVTRNAAGNVTEVLKSLPLYNDMRPAYKTVWTYGEDGKADTYEYYGNYSYTSDINWQLEESTSYRNIKWAATDGQLVRSIDTYIEGDNRIASAEVYYEDELDGHMFVEYNDEKPGDYVIKQTTIDPSVVGMTTSRKYTDAFGSYILTVAEYFDGEGNFTEEPTYMEVNTVTCNEYGYVIENCLEISSPVEGYSAVNIEKYETVYDENGNLHEVTTYTGAAESEYGQNPDIVIGVELEPTYRMVYGEYTDITTGLDKVQAAGAYPATVYNAQGIAIKTIDSDTELNSLPAGFYIVNGKKYIRR